jgi:hypothetical protein
MPFEYPKHPNTGRSDPFLDEMGNNPFADDGPAAEVSDDPYAVGASHAGPTFQPDNFETTLPHRGGRVLAIGSVGLVLCVLGAAGIAACVAAPDIAGSWLTLSATSLLFGFSCAPTAWIMGRSDLRAIRSGAMDDAGFLQTRRGHAFGVIGTLIAVAPFVWAIVMLIQSIAEEL